MSAFNRLSNFPLWFGRWLGYRPSSPGKEPEYAFYIWSFVGTFCGLSVLQAIFEHSKYFQDRHVPSIVASYGASAVLCFGAIGVPFSQPRALVGGHFISALVGVCITKLFGLIPSVQRFDSLRWLAGSLSTAVAIWAMQVTKTTHPPAGATALLAAVEPSIYSMGWYYLPVVLLSSMIILITALIFNNVQRRYPVFWIAPVVPANAEPSTALGAPEKLSRVPELYVQGDNSTPSQSGDLENGTQSAAR